MPWSTALRRKLHTVLWIALAWSVISMTQLGYEAAILQEYSFSYRWSRPGAFMTYFTINTLAFVVNGLVAGAVIVFLLRPYIRYRSYTYGLLFGAGMYTLLFFLLTGVQNYFVVRSIWDGSGSFWTAYGKGLTDYFFSFEFVRNFPFWLLVLTATLAVLFVSDKYGPGGLRKFLLGRYFRPRSEERIFMFMDLKGSTTIAEQLGELRYFQFIQRVFQDVTPVLLETRGEIYQYVGDEVIVSWTVREGLQNLNCIRCFQEVKQHLEDLSPGYEKDFGVVPEFKAGLHVGRSIVGEIGVIKRDIAYSGDVLNTAARIQGKCNELGAKLLVSEDLARRLPTESLSLSPKGKVALRGKAEAMELFGL